MIELPINVCPNTFDLLPNPKIEIFHLIYFANVFYSVLILLQTPNFKWKKRTWKKNHLWQLSSFPVGWRLFIYLNHIWNRWTGLSSKMKPTKKMKFLSNQTAKIYWENITFGIATALKIFKYLFSCFVSVCFHSVFFHLRFITFKKKINEKENVFLHGLQREITFHIIFMEHFQNHIIIMKVFFWKWKNNNFNCCTTVTM